MRKLIAATLVLLALLSSVGCDPGSGGNNTITLDCRGDCDAAAFEMFSQ